MKQKIGDNPLDDLDSDDDQIKADLYLFLCLNKIDL